MISGRQLKLDANMRETQPESFRCNTLRKMIRKLVYSAIIVTLNAACIFSSLGLDLNSNLYSKLCGTGVILNVTTYAEQSSARRSLECAESCSRNRKCDGFNYFSPARTCHLLFYRLTRGYNCRSLAVPKPAAAFYHRNFKCFNNGTYIDGRCDCFDGWVGKHCQKLAKDCSELYEVYGVRSCSGRVELYNITSCLIQPNATRPSFRVYCWLNEQFNFGQTLIQANTVNRACQVPFNRTWAAYRNGFGYCPYSFWLGNERIHELTADGDSTLFVTIWTDSNQVNQSLFTYIYGNFTVGPESSDYSVSINIMRSGPFSLYPTRDSFMPYGEPKSNINGQRFSTFDRDNDRFGGSCAQVHGCGWWFNNCTAANVNGNPVNYNQSIYQPSGGAPKLRPSDINWKYDLDKTPINATVMGLLRAP